LFLIGEVCSGIVIIQMSTLNTLNILKLNNFAYLGLLIWVLNF